MKSFLSYFGGKSLLAGKIIPKFPEHSCYIEAFAGAAWLLFKKEESQIEIINDINKDLTTLYRVVKFHLEEFIRYFKWALISRDEFERLKLENPDTLTDIQRSARFYYLIKNGYSSRIPNPSFSINTTRRSNFNLLRIEEELSAAHLRLTQVYIENLHFTELIPRFDKHRAFFYLDPPYYNHEKDYGKGIFKRDDFDSLAGLLMKLQGKFILSLNDTPEVRQIYKGFHIEEVVTMYNTAASAGSKKKVTELLIMNYTPPKVKD